MNGVDYTKNLSRERSNMQKTIEKDREATQKRLADEEARHIAAQKKQAAVYDRDRAKLEAAYKDKVDAHKEFTVKTLDEQKGKFHEITEAERDKFHQDRANISRDFDSRFRSIQDSYSRNANSQREVHEVLRAAEKNRFKKNVDEIAVEKNQQIKKFQDRMVGAGSDLREENRMEKEKLTRLHESRLEGVYREEGGKRTDLKDHLQTDIKRMRDSHAAEREQTQEYTKDKVRVMADNFSSSSSKIAEDYAKKNQVFTDTAAKENKQRTREHQSEIVEVRQGFDKDLRSIEIEKRRRDNGSGEFAEVVKRQQGMSDEKAYKDKIDRLRNASVDQQRVYNRHRDRDAEKTAEILQTESANASDNLEKVTKRLTADKIVSMSKEREKASKIQQGLQVSQIAERQGYEQQLVVEREGSQGRIEKLKANFNESLRRLEAGNQKFMTDIKKSTDEEKSNAITAGNLQRNSEIQDLRKSFNNLMMGTVDSYEQKLKRAEGENVKLRDQLDQKVAFVMKEADQKVSEHVRMASDEKRAQDKANQAAIARREADQKSQIRELTSSYTQKMEKLSYDSEMRLKNTVSTYENKLKEQQAAFTKAANEKDIQHSTALANLRTNMNNEKAQLISQYENQLNQTKMASQEQIDKLNDYKRMG
jgi:hypothetical protein